MEEITRLVDAVTDADRSATIHGGTDRARRASDARSALLRAVEGVVGRLETETKERERCRYGWKRCAADLARETSRGNRAEERAEKAEADRDEAEDQRARAERAESVLAAARALVESEQAWGLQYGDARCIWCGASPADPMEVHGDGCEFGALVRALSSAPPYPSVSRDAPWYLADGSTVMLPADEVERRRKAAAVVLEVARRVVRDLYYANGPGGALLNELRARFADLDAAPVSGPGDAANSSEEGA